MTSLAELAVVGMDHRGGTGAHRGRLLARRGELEARVADAVRTGAARGGAVLATCLRVEAVLSGADASTVAAIAVWMRSGADSYGTEGSPYVRRGADAARHALRVAASLESLVPGEREVARQVRKAFEAARAEGLLDRPLNALDRACTDAARAVHAEVFSDARAQGFAGRTLDAVRAAGARSVLVLGLGELGRTAASLLAPHVRTLALANRHPRTPAQLGPVLAGLDVRTLDDGLALARDVDAVVVATASAAPLLRAHHLGDARPLVVDLGTPPQVAADVPGTVRLAELSRDALAEETVRAARIVERQLERLQGRLGPDSRSAVRVA